MKKTDVNGNTVDEVTLGTTSGQQPVDIQGHRMDEFDIIVAQSVAAGADYTAPTVYDFSPYGKVQYGINTASTGSGTTNIVMYTIEGSAYKLALRSSVNSNYTAWTHLTGVVDVTGIDTLNFVFRNADIQSITVSLKAYCQA